MSDWYNKIIFNGLSTQSRQPGTVELASVESHHGRLAS